MTRAGMLLVALGSVAGLLGLLLAIAAPSPGEGGSFGGAIAPYVILLALPPFVAGLTILRRQRFGRLAGMVIGGLYAALLLLRPQTACSP